MGAFYETELNESTGESNALESSRHKHYDEEDGLAKPSPKKRESMKAEKVKEKVWEKILADA